MGGYPGVLQWPDPEGDGARGSQPPRHAQETRQGKLDFFRSRASCIIRFVTMKQGHATLALIITQPLVYQ